MKNAEYISGSHGSAKNLSGSGGWGEKNVDKSFATFKFSSPTAINTIVLEESGSKILSYEIYGKVGGGQQLLYRGDKIEQYRYCTVKAVTVEEITIKILKARSNFMLKEMSVYNIDSQNDNFRVNEYVALDREDDFAVSEKLGDENYSKMFDTVTDVTFMPGLGIQEGGVISYWPHGTSERTDREMAALKQILGDRDIDLYLTVFSDTADISPILNNDSDRLIEGYLALAEKYGLNGFDIDWEYPAGDRQWASYSKFLVKFKAALEPKGLKLTIAMSSWCNGITKAAIKALDYVNVMIYDSKDEDGWHSSYDYFVECASTMEQKGFNKLQLLLGLPFYGRDTATRGNYVAYKDAKISNRWMNVVEGHEFVDGDGNKLTRDIFFNGYQMIMDKTAYAKDFGYGGVMTWQYMTDEDYSSPFSLHKAMEEGIAR